MSSTSALYANARRWRNDKMRRRMQVLYAVSRLPDNRRPYYSRGRDPRNHRMRRKRILLWRNRRAESVVGKMTQEQIENAEDHYDDYLRYSQECFGISWTPGNPCDVCDCKKECSEKYLSKYQNMAPVWINTCEYEKRWETICRSQGLTDPKDSVHYVSYSCALCFCRYPERECNVKKVQ